MPINILNGIVGPSSDPIKSQVGKKKRFSILPSDDERGNGGMSLLGILGGAAAGWDDPGYAGREQTAKRLRRHEYSTAKEFADIAEEEETEKIAQSFIGSPDPVTGKAMTPNVAYTTAKQLVNEARRAEPMKNVYAGRYTSGMMPTAEKTGKLEAKAGIAERLQRASDAYLGKDRAESESRVRPYKEAADIAEYSDKPDEIAYGAEQRRAKRGLIPLETETERSRLGYQRGMYDTEKDILPAYSTAKLAKLNYEGAQAESDTENIGDIASTDRARRALDREKSESETGLIPERRTSAIARLEPEDMRAERRTKEQLARTVGEDAGISARNSFEESQDQLDPSLPRLSTAALQNIADRASRSAVDKTYAQAATGPMLEAAGRAPYARYIGATGGQAAVGRNLGDVSDVQRKLTVNPYATDADIAEAQAGQRGAQYRKRATERDLIAGVDQAQADAKASTAELIDKTNRNKIASDLPRISSATEVDTERLRGEIARQNLGANVPEHQAKAAAEQAQFGSQSWKQQRAIGEKAPDVLEAEKKATQTLERLVKENKIREAEIPGALRNIMLSIKTNDESKLSDTEKELKMTLDPSELEALYKMSLQMIRPGLMNMDLFNLMNQGGGVSGNAADLLNNF
jgi:hypothetical protein